jgi:glycosyltransferase involved in cell wall biosynthesis
MIDELLSVIIPTRNRCNLLERAIESVQKQEDIKLEIIIINDASNDNTLEFLEDLSHIYSNVKYINTTKAVGGSKARNLGINIATGHYIAFLDDDDVWLPNKCIMQINLLKANNKYSAVTCNFKIIYDRLPITRTKKITSISKQNSIYSFNFLGGTSMCLTYTKHLKTINGFDENLPSCQDWDLWIKLSNLGEIAIVDESLVNYYSHANERISLKLKNVYAGRVKIYFKYKDSMSKQIRLKNISAIFFIKLMMRNDSIVNKLKRLMIILPNIKLRDFFIYIRILTVSDIKSKLFS